MKKNNKNKIIAALTIIGCIGIFIGVDMALFKPTALNRFLATKIYKEAAHPDFIDVYFYECVIDSYNAIDAKESDDLAYTAKITNTQLKSIKKLSCDGNRPEASGKIVRLKGIHLLTNLEEADFSNNALVEITDYRESDLEIPKLPEKTTSTISMKMAANNRVNPAVMFMASSSSSDGNVNPTPTPTPTPDGGDSGNNNGGTIPGSSDNNGNTLPDDDHFDELLYLSTLQYNIYLKKLNVSGNKLKTLYLKNNLLLEELDASNNLLSKVETNALPELKELDLSKNQLTEVDISPNEKIEKLTVNNNANTVQLFKSHMNQKLKEIYLNDSYIYSGSQNFFAGLLALEILEARSAGLAELDLTYSAGLKKLDLSNNENINSTLDLSKNIVLETLNLSNTNVSGINLSKNVNLKVLDMTNVVSDKTVNLDFSNNSKLETLKLDNNNIATINLNKNTSLTTLFLSNNAIASIDLTKNTNLTNLSLASNKITSIDLSKNTKLINLYLQSNQIANIDLEANTAIATLNVNANKLKSLDLSKQTSLLTLYINDNQYSQTQYIYKGEQKKLANPVTFPTHVNEKWNNYSYTVIGTSVIDVSKGKVTALSAGNGIATIKLIVPYDEYNSITVPPTNTIRPTNSTVDPMEETSAGAQAKNGTTPTTKPLHVEVYNAQTTVKVVELTSDVYKIDQEKGYIYLEDENATDVVLNNISLGPTEYPDLHTPIDWNHNEVRIVEYTSDTSKTIKTFKIIRYISEYDIIEKGTVKYIYLGVSKFEPSKITTYNCSAVLEGDVVQIKDSVGTVIDEFKLIKVSSSKYSNLNNGIYEGTGDLVREDIKVANGIGRIANGNFVVYLGTEEKDENIVARIPIIGIDSSKYDLSKDYIYLGTETFDVSKITVNNGTAKVENNQLKILNSDNVVLDTFDLISISSTKYGSFLSKNYIYVGSEEFNIGSIVLSGKAEKEYKDNTLNIKYGNTVLATYDIKSIKFNNLKVTGNNIYISSVMSYGDFTKNIVATGTNYKIYDGSTLINSGNLNKNLTLKVYVGTEQVNTYSILVELFEVEDDIILDETNKLVKYLPQGLTVKELKDKITTSGTIVVKDKDDKTPSDTSILKTGQKLIVTLPNKTYTYTIVVKGDVNGDGKIDLNDVSKVYACIKGRHEMEKYEHEAGNVVGAKGESVNLSDVSLLYAYIKGRETDLEV